MHHMPMLLTKVLRELEWVTVAKVVVFCASPTSLSRTGWAVLLCSRKPWAWFLDQKKKTICAMFCTVWPTRCIRSQISLLPWILLMWCGWQIVTRFFHAGLQNVSDKRLAQVWWADWKSPFDWQDSQWRNDHRSLDQYRCTYETYEARYVGWSHERCDGGFDSNKV